MNITTQSMMNSAIRQKNNAFNIYSEASKKLSSGLKIRQAADDAAGLAISQKLRAQVNELNKVKDNIRDGKNLTAVADGGLTEITAILQRMNELAIAAANGVYTDEDRAKCELEFEALKSEIDGIATRTEFNTIKVLQGQWGWWSTYTLEELKTPTIWGRMDYIKDVSFNAASPATPATLTLPLDPNIKTVADLNGMTFTVNHASGSTTNFYIATDADTANTAPANSNNIVINLTSYLSTNNMSGALNSIANTVSSRFVYNPTTTVASITSTAQTSVPYSITFKGELAQYRFTLPPTSVPPSGWANVYNNANGEWGNNNSVSVNTVIGADPITGTLGQQHSMAFDAPYPNYALTTLDLSKISGSTSSLNGHSINFLYSPNNATAGSISFSNTVGSGVYVGDNPDVNTLISRINATLPIAGGGYTIKAASTSATEIDFSVSSSSGTMIGSNFRIGETPKPAGTTSGTQAGQSPIGVSVSAGNHETFTTATLTLPANPADLVHTALNVNINGTNRTFYFYDSTAASNNRAPSNSLYNFDLSTVTNYPVGLANTLSMYMNYGSATSKQNSGNIDITFSNVGNYNVTLSNPSLTPTYNNPPNPPLLLTSQKYFSLEAKGLDLDFTGLSLPTDLLGRGFAAVDNNGNSVLYEFTNSITPLTGKTPINVSSVTNLTGLATLLQSRIPNTTVNANAPRIVINPPNPFLTSSNLVMKINEGISDFGSLLTGLASTNRSSFSGGTNLGKSTAPSSALDFSWVTSTEKVFEAMSTGGGFRVTCATCPNEWINFYFVPEDIPDSELIPAMSNNINNIPVRIGNSIGSGEALVNTILSQLSGKLVHFTEIKADPNNPAALIVQDKRPGDFPSPPAPAKVLSGIDSSYQYNIITGETRSPYDLNIYVGSGQMIPIRIPIVNAEELSLKTVTIDTQPSAIAAVDLIASALRDIIDIRTEFGVKSNRLSHALEATETTYLNTSAALSRIEDLDMAKEMMRLTKYRVLDQAATSMLLHSRTNQESVIKLLTR